MKIVIPMAGKGSRFLDVADQNPEYKKPKPLISVKGKPMVCWAIESLPFVELKNRKAGTDFKVYPKDLVFICRQDHQEDFNIANILKETFGTDITIILLDHITRGATETALKAKEYINQDEEIIISDSDHYFDGTPLYETILKKNEDVRGIIPVFRPPDNDIKWSYTLFDENFYAIDVNEKDPVLAGKGAFANIGAYYFSSGAEFVTEAEAMIAENDVYGPQGKQEFYLAPIYRRFLNKNKKIQVAVTPTVWGLGTPKDVESFENNFINLK